MAQKAVTPGKDYYCASCSAKVTADDDSCPNCNEDFGSSIDAGLCGTCHSIITIKTNVCKRCGGQFAPVMTDEGIIEEEFQKRIKHWRNLPNLAKPKPRIADSKFDTEMAPGVSTDLWKIFEPMERVIKTRMDRLENLEPFLAEAKKRIDELEYEVDPELQKEKWRLKRLLDEIPEEKKDLDTIEQGLSHVEKTYKNYLEVQQEEIKTKEEVLRKRVDAFKKEIDRLEKDKDKIRDREADVLRKEDEIRKILDKIYEKEAELAGLEVNLKDKLLDIENYWKKLADAKMDVGIDEWFASQKKLQSQLMSLRSDKLLVEPGSPEVSEIRTRVTELEEKMEKLTEERIKMIKEKEETLALISDVSKVLKTLDELLGELPPEVIKKFAKGNDFRLYEKILEKCGV